MKPIISIIVPAYNLEAYIGKCLDSILAQTYTNFEVIVINDGSTDSSGEIIEQYAKKDKRVKVIHKSYGGVSSARNVGVEAAVGEYIGFVDGDDWVYNDFYERLYSLCLKYDCDIAICNIYRQINGTVNKVKRDEFIKTLNNSEAMMQLFRGELFRFALWNKLYKRSCFEGVQFPEGRIHEDLSTTYRLFANAKKIMFTNYTGYIYVKRENSILTEKFNEKRLDAFIGWNEIIPFMNQRYPQLSKDYLSCFVYWSIDNVYYVLHQVSESEERQRYLTEIQEYVRNHIKDINNVALTLKYKFLITLLVNDVRLIMLNNKVKSQMNSLLLRFAAKRNTRS